MLITRTQPFTNQTLMIPDAEIAQIMIWDGYFSQYSPSFVVTNEDVRYALKFMPQKTENALVVAASGDLPIFTTLCGATNVDTFDISYNAKVIMDIKTAAIHTMTYPEYKQLLRDMYKSKDLVSIKNISKIIPILPPIEQKYIADMRGSPLCMYGCAPDNNQVLTKLSPTEFYKIRKTLPRSFNFIWSDIQELSARLTKTYDFMHFSNILDYLGLSESVNTLRSLMKHARSGSTICIENLYPSEYSKRAFADVFTTLLIDNSKWEWNIFSSNPEISVLYVMQCKQR